MSIMAGPYRVGLSAGKENVETLAGSGYENIVMAISTKRNWHSPAA